MGEASESRGPANVAVATGLLDELLTYDGVE
jgi:hypothetical protein